MIRKYRYGAPFDTEALTEKIETAEEAFPYGEISQKEGFAFTYIMDEDDIVYGLGESNRGINKRGYCYISNCTDDPIHTEDKRSLYGAHNFIIVSGKTTFGLFFDYPSKLTFDIGYTRMDTLKVSCENADLDIYVIEGENAYDIVKQFRRVIGRSYIPPKFAFGFGQSRWGYTTKEDFRAVAKGYRENHIPFECFSGCSCHVITKKIMHFVVADFLTIYIVIESFVILRTVNNIFHLCLHCPRMDLAFGVFCKFSGEFFCLCKSLRRIKDCRFIHIVPESLDSLVDQETVFISEPFPGFRIQHIRKMGISRPYSCNKITSVFSFTEVVIFYTFLVNLVAFFHLDAGINDRDQADRKSNV